MSTLNIEELNVDDDVKQRLKKLNIDEITSLQHEIITNLTSGQGSIVKPNPKDRANTTVVSALSVAGDDTDETGTNCLVISFSAKGVDAISEQIAKFKTSDLTCATMDEKMKAQQKKAVLDKEPNILVTAACPLQKTMRKMRHVFRDVNYIILDGFDEMNTAVQRDCLKRIRLRTLSDYTTLMFVSKLEDDTKERSSNFVEDPVSIGFKDASNGRATSPPDLLPSLKQGFVNVPSRMKISTLMALIDQSSSKKTVIFTASKRGTDRLYKILKKQNLGASSIHGRLSESKKEKRFKRFTSGKASYLIVADIPATELQLNDIHQVINYDVPSDTDEYRFRTAILHSNKAKGIVSLVSGQDQSDIKGLQNELKTKMTELDLPATVQEKVKNRKKQSKKKQQKKGEMELPRPSYDKLSGGRNGDHDDEENGIVQLFKKLFTS